MESFDITTQLIMPLIGGALIGFSVTLMLVLNGRVTGISGIVNGLLTYEKKDMVWRAVFVLGLLAGGGALMSYNPALFQNISGRNLATIGIGGLFVGFGTVMGSGCTSGHGVCGMSRMSPRSFVATLTFIGLGVVTVFIFRMFFGSAL